jgi:RNA polymerase sigma factor (sigma-70 family)
VSVEIGDNPSGAATSHASRLGRGAAFGLDEGSFAEMYQQLLGPARVVVEPGDDAMEVLHEALVKCLTRFGRRDGPMEPRSYVARAVINEARSRRRRLRTRRRTRQRLALEREPPGVATAVADAVSLLVILPPRQRACVYLRHVEDLSVRDTAALLGCDEGTVKSQTAKAIQTLRRAGMAADQEVTADDCLEP